MAEINIDVKVYELAKFVLRNTTEADVSAEVAAIAKALREVRDAEREQCAKVADSWSNENARVLAANLYGLTDNQIDVAINVARGIAGAIRSGAHEYFMYEEEND